MKFLRTVIAAICLTLAHEIHGLSVRDLDKKVGPVVFVNVLYRHGDRNPTDPFPNDPYRSLKYWPEGYGQLTNAGKLHQFQLGRWLRKRYLHLIPNGKYHYDIIKINSTNVDRVLMSAESNLAGMFPPEKAEKWGSLNWQPIPVHTVPSYLDSVMSMGAPCDKYDRLYKQFKKSREYKNIMKKYEPLLKLCSKYSGKNCTSLGSMYDLNSDLTIEKLRNFTLPTWTAEIFPNKTGEAGAVDFAFDTWTLGMKRLEGGPLVKQMVENLNGKLSGDMGRQTIAMYSGHDSTIVNVLNTMGLYDFVLPPFYSSFYMELRQGSGNQQLVTILYKNTTDPAGEPMLLRLPGCNEACPLKYVNEILRPVLPENWEEECKDEDYDDEEEEEEEMTLKMNPEHEGNDFYDFNVEPIIKEGKRHGLGYRRT